MRDADFNAFARSSRRDSIQSGYGSCDESGEQQPRKRAKLYRAEAPGKADLNIERQPSSLRVAASTAASVRIHRPTPINPLISAAQNSGEEPIRPPTPISDMNSLPRRVRPLPSLLRESSIQSNTQYTSPYPMSDDHPSVEPTATSPAESRYQGLFEPSFSMPSSPPVLDYGFPTRSSPVLPPMAADLDSGFMSGGIDELLDDELGPPIEGSTRPASKNTARSKRTVRSAAQASSPANVIEIPDTQPANHSASEAAPDRQSQLQNQAEIFPANEMPAEQQKQQQQATEVAVAPPRASQIASRPSSRPSSRASVRQTHKPLAPAPISQSELEQLLSAIPASDPITGQWPAPSSDIGTAETPGAQLTSEDGKPRSGAGARRMKQVKQVQARLEKCIRDGQVPPYCENCGAIETPTWRRAHSKEIKGTEDEANELAKDPLVFFWRTVDKDEQEKVTKFKIYKKSLADADKDFAQVLLCNRK